MLDTLPRNLGKMDQAIRSVDIYEGTKIRQAGYPSCAYITFLKLVEQAVFEGLACFLECLAFGQDQTATRAVDFDHAHVHLFPDHPAITLVWRFVRQAWAAQQADLGGRDEPPQPADRHNQSSLVVADYLAGIHLVRGKQAFYFLPILLLARSQVRKHHIPVIVFGFNYKNRNFLSLKKGLTFFVGNLVIFPS